MIDAFFGSNCGKTKIGTIYSWNMKNNEHAVPMLDAC